MSKYTLISKKGMISNINKKTSFTTKVFFEKLNFILNNSHKVIKTEGRLYLNNIKFIVNKNNGEITISFSKIILKEDLLFENFEAENLNLEFVNCELKNIGLKNKSKFKSLKVEKSEIAGSIILIDSEIDELQIIENKLDKIYISKKSRVGYISVNNSIVSHLTVNDKSIIEYFDISNDTQIISLNFYDSKITEDFGISDNSIISERLLFNNSFANDLQFIDKIKVSEISIKSSFINSVLFTDSIEIVKIEFIHFTKVFDLRIEGASKISFILFGDESILGNGECKLNCVRAFKPLWGASPPERLGRNYEILFGLQK